MSGISWLRSRGALRSSHNFDGELASPAKRHALPTTAIGSLEGATIKDEDVVIDDDIDDDTGVGSRMSALEQRNISV